MWRQCELLRVTWSQVYYEAKEPEQTDIERKEAILARIDYWNTMMLALGARR